MPAISRHPFVLRSSKVRADSNACNTKAFEDIGVTEMDARYYDTRTVSIEQDGVSTEYYPWVFSKTLNHHPVYGLPTKEDVDKMLASTSDGGAGNRSAIVQHPQAVRKLVSVNAGLSSYAGFGDPKTFKMSPNPAIESKESVFEMMEVYEQALLRDTTFADIQSETGADVTRALAMANAYGTANTGPKGDDGVTRGEHLFRGLGKDECVGPYVSQYLYLPFNYGNIPVEQKFETELDATDSVTMNGWLDIQNGIIGGSANKDALQFCHTPRVLGAKVHNDPLFQFYYNAALISLQNGIGPDSTETAYSPFEAFVNTGPPDVLGAVATVATLALRAAFHQKWYKFGMVRPEVLAQRIDLADRGTYDGLDFPGLDDLKTNMEFGRDTLNAVAAANVAANGSAAADSRMLMLQFPEGSPVHPSLPAGHAAVAGACVTVLKAMLKCHDASGARAAWPSTPMHSIDGDNLVEYAGADAGSMTIIGELNKLASNISIGRDLAGVHYRCDGDCGIKLGEDVAIDFLRNKAKEYYEGTNGQFDKWILEKFDGTTIVIHP